jgi:guanylate kinase
LNFIAHTSFISIQVDASFSHTLGITTSATDLPDAQPSSLFFPNQKHTQDGVHYHFTTRESFESDISQSKFLEYAHVHKNIYGTSIKAVQDVATSGKCCVLDIDVQGARQVRAAPRLPAIFVFVAPPNQEELEKRLRGRGTDSEEQVITRLDSARVEMESAENEPALYDYVIVNDSLEKAVGELRLVAEAALRGEVGRNVDIGRKIGNNSNDNDSSGAETTGHPPPPAAAAAAAATVLA